MTEVEQIARETWAAMATGERPMPPEFALDRVQDVTDDRDEAVIELCRAAAVWLAGERVVFVLVGVSAAGGETHTGNGLDAELVQGYIRAEVLNLADTYLRHIRERCLRAAATDSRVENRAASLWMMWAGKAERTLRLIAELGRAAHPQAA